MRKIYLLISFFLVLTLSQISMASQNRLIEATVAAPSLKGNFFNDPIQQTLLVYLPPSYYNSEKRYPVVYFLHGFGGSPYSAGSFGPVADSLIEKNIINEFIIVGVNGNNRLGGSFYVNSPVIGNWEDFVVKDVVGYIDNNYRTIAKSTSRGIAGFSMGGFASMNLAFRHPSLFGVLYSLAPGLFDENGLPQAMDSWDQGFKNAYGAAFSPNPNNPFPHADIPRLDNTVNDNTIKSNWENGFGNLNQKIADYLSKGKTLKGIRIEYGKEDRYNWIINGCEYFSKLLTAKNIPHELNVFYGRHELTLDLIKNSILPFFSIQLDVKQ